VNYRQAGTAVKSNGETAIRNEIRPLTGLRAVAAAWVVVYHFWALTPGDHWGSVVEPVLPIVKSGWLGVDLFFVLSGFVLCHTYSAKLGPRPKLRATVSFYWNRLSRVWPLWAFVTLAFTGWLVLKQATVGGPLLHEGAQPTLGLLPLLEQLLMVQVWASPHSWATGVVGPGWSLSAEWLAYVTFPVVVLVLHRLRRLPAVALAAGAVLMMLPFAYTAVTSPEGVGFAWNWFYRIAGGFLAGALVSLCVRRIEQTERVRRAASYVAAGAVVQILVVVWWADLYGKTVAVAVLLFPVLIGALAMADAGPARFLSGSWINLAGRFSFALYLVHECVFEVFWTAMDVVPRLQAGSALVALLLPVVLVTTLPAAYLLWRFVEEPARRAMRRMSEARRKPAPVRPSRHAAAARVVADPLPMQRPAAETASRDDDTVLATR
jgi:peptidoglycan/LPS O-acetylase OafA/YrhL